MTQRLPSSQCVPSEQSRRTVLAATGTAATVALAGCAGVVNYLGDRILEDVVMFNETERRVAGTITVLDPGGETVLDSQFDLPPSEEDDEGPSNEEGSEENTGIFADVFTEHGDYEVSLELDNPVGDVSEATETVTVADIEEEHIVVALGDVSLPEPVWMTVIENFSDLAEQTEAARNESSD